MLSLANHDNSFFSIEMSIYIHRELDDATAAAIVRSSQKDEFYIDRIYEQVSAVTRMLSTSRNGIDSKTVKALTRVLYFGLTTALGARTFGEEYVDLYYTNSGRRVQRWRKALFVVLYALMPYLISKFSKWLSNKLPESPDNWKGILKKVLNHITTVTLLDIQNVHLALFYIKGKYYDISKRMLGLQYGLGYRPAAEQREQKRGSEYELLGGLMLLQLAIKYTNVLKLLVQGNINSSNDSTNAKFKQSLKRGNIDIAAGNCIGALEVNESDVHIDLADPTKLAYITNQSRSCMLCLDPMKDPSCGPCGHVFCWLCILEWCKERNECPLCRSPLKDNQLIPLR